MFTINCRKNVLTAGTTILTGNDEKGTFAPLTSITRAEAAAIVSRMVDVNNRKTVSLADPFL